MTLGTLVQRQIETRLKPWYAVDRRPPPRGWLEAIRRAIGMNAVQLGRRLGVTRQAITDLDARERDSSATLASLRRAAAAMDCDLVYAIVPRTSVTEIVKAQAKKKATEELRRVAHTMGLENQSTRLEEVDRLVAERADQLLRGSRRALWGHTDDPTGG